MNLKTLKTELKLPIETLSERLMVIYGELLKDNRKEAKRLKQVIKNQKER